MESQKRPGYISLISEININRPALQAELNKVLCSILDRNYEVGYVQGLNDVIGTLMLILGTDHALLAGERVCLHYIKDMLLSTFDEGMMPILRLILKIVKEVDPEVHKQISAVMQEVPGFALSWVLTWMSHEIKDLNNIARVFDYLLCSHPITPALIAAAVLLVQ